MSSTEPGTKTRPNAEAVGWRALAIVAIMFRANLERELTEERRASDVASQLDGLLRNWIDREGVGAHLAPAERTLLEQPLGSWKPAGVAEASWQNEAVGALLWASGEIETLPPYDTQFDLYSIISDLPVFGDPASFLQRLQLQSDAAIDNAFATARAWYWRARAAELFRRSGLSPAPQNLQAALDATGVEPLKGDFAAFGKPYRELLPEETATCSAIASARYHALNWLVGQASSWDEPAPSP